MHQFKKEEFAYYISGSAQKMVAVLDTGPKWAMVLPVFGDNNQEMKVDMDQLIYIPPVKVSLEQLKKICRYEMTLKDLQITYPYNLAIEGQYPMTLEDLHAAIDHYLSKKDRDADDFDTWVHELHDPLGEAVHIDGASLYDQESIDELPNASDTFNQAMDLLFYYDGDYEGAYDFDAAAQQSRKIIDRYYENEKLPLLERTYTKDEKALFLRLIGHQSMAKQSEELKSFWRHTLEESAQEDDAEALKILGEAYYGEGNGGFLPDWKKARKYLQQGMKQEPDGWTAYLLGCIAADGSADDGIPQYHEAFEDFSIALAAGNALSRFRLADLFIDGHGVRKSVSIARNLIDELYVSQRMSSSFISNRVLAEVAYRKGNLEHLEKQDQEHLDRSYYYYLQAEYAQEVSMLECHRYGDELLLQKIQQAIKEVLPHTGYTKAVQRVEIQNMQVFLKYPLNEGCTIRLHIDKISTEEAELTFTMPMNSRTFLVTIPEAHYCQRVDKIVMRAENIALFHFSKRGDIEFNSCIGNNYYLADRWVAMLDAQFFYEVKPNKGMS